MNPLPGFVSRLLLAILLLARSNYSFRRLGAAAPSHGLRRCSLTRRYDSSGSTSDGNFKVESKNSCHKIEFEVGGKTMSFETGKIGRQASGAVTARVADTMLYTTVCIERDAQPVDFTPLRVDYFARYSAVGQTVGAFHRRDSRGDDNEILVARLVDRPIRPMIAEGWQHDTQILTWVLSYDKAHAPEALSICSASAAMCVSEVPITKPIAGVEVGLVEGAFVVNPTKQQMANSTLQLTVAGTRDGILMIEGQANFLSEETMMQAIGIAHEAIKVICSALEQFQALVGKKKKTETLRRQPKELLDDLDAKYGAMVTAALSIADKHARGARVEKVEKLINADLLAQANLLAIENANMAGKESQDQDDDVVKDEDDVMIVDDSGNAKSIDDEDEASEIALVSKIEVPVAAAKAAAPYDSVDIKIAIKKLLVRKLRQKILTTGKRSDGREVDEVRPISIETSLLPRAHGSSLFTRGETQAIATATLGGKGMEARFESLDEVSTKKFYLQYRFPPSSVGEVGRVGGVGRREVGHGNLAERALLPAIPSLLEFPYSIRAESLITESCGSSSMATVCGCCLAMLDAGVPLTSSVAGVAMGLILGEKEGDEPVILTDILGLEDALGTMDFKVAGNETGITAFQLDIKSDGLTPGVLEKALFQAKGGRLKILNEMKLALAAPRKLKDTIPRILEFTVPTDSIGKVIGPKGKTIQTLIETHGVTNINIQDDGTVQVESFSTEKCEEAKAAIMKIAEEAMRPKEEKVRRPRGDKADGADGAEAAVEKGPPPEDGMVYRECAIKGIHTFGVFVEVLPGYEGLVHISELDTKKVASVEKSGFVVGQSIDVKYLGKNEKGQMRLSRKAVLLRDSPSTATGARAEPAKPSLSAAAEAAFNAPPASG